MSIWLSASLVRFGSRLTMKKTTSVRQTMVRAMPPRRLSMNVSTLPLPSGGVVVFCGENGKGRERGPFL